jgi:hypothetical protein
MTETIAAEFGSIIDDEIELGRVWLKGLDGENVGGASILARGCLFVTSGVFEVEAPTICGKPCDGTC